jgi:hypothetical protein
MRKEISISDIRIDGDTQARTRILQEVAQGYADCMKRGDEFPPIETVFDGKTYWLVDGFHRYIALKLLNIKKVEVLYQKGSQLEAQVISFGVNSKHGLQRTNEDKVKSVESALKHELTKDLTDTEIAKICDVSKPFVAAIRNPEVKARQQENRKRHMRKAVEEDVKAPVESNPITAQAPEVSNPITGEAPDESELLANQKKHEADKELLASFLDADDKMAHLYEENTKLAHLNMMQDLRIKELMNEKNAAIKMVKDLQKQLDKFTKAKK